jgi:hypothetical protein
VILKFYKSDKLTVLVSLPIIGVLLWLPRLLNPTVIDFSNASPLFQWVYNAGTPFFLTVIALIIIVISALILNDVINKNEIFSSNTFLPALIYLISMSAIKEHQALSPIVISNLFWILAFKRLFNVYSHVPCKKEVFDATVLVLFGGLFYFPSILMVGMVWIALIILRPFVWREWVIPFFAFIVFGVYYIVALIWRNALNNWLDYFTFDSEQYSSINITVSWPYYILLGVVLVLVSFSGYNILKRYKASSLRFRKIIFFFLFIIILTIAILSLVQSFSNENVYSLVGAVPLSLLITFYFNYAKKEWLSQLFFYTIFISILVNIYLY